MTDQLQEGFLFYMKGLQQVVGTSHFAFLTKKKNCTYILTCGLEVIALEKKRRRNGTSIITCGRYVDLGVIGK